MQFLFGNFGSGKTEHIIQKSIELLKNNKKMWIIVPSRRHKNELLLRITQKTQSIIGTPVITLKELQIQLLENIFTKNSTSPKTISNFENFLILSHIIQENTPKFKSFKNISQRPEMIKMIYRLIQSLRDQDINELPATPEMEYKIEDLRLILNIYQDMLVKKNLCDNKQEIDFICSRLFEVSSDLIPEYIFIDGFVDFTATQFKLISFLAKHSEKLGSQICITLTDTSHSICTETIKQFNDYFPHAESTYLSYHSASTKLAESFLNNSPFTNDSLEIYEIQAFGRHKEIEEVINQIKHLCLFQDYSLKDILIITNQQDRYTPMLTSILHKARIPFEFSKDDLLSQNPLIMFIKKILQIMQDEIDHETIEFLAHSNYVDDSIRFLLGKTNELVHTAVKGKKEAWKFIFQKQLEINNENQETHQEHFSDLQDLILELCDRLFISEVHKEQLIIDHITNLTNLLEFLKIPECLSKEYNLSQHRDIIENSVAKDYAALAKFKEILGDLKKSLENIGKTKITLNSFIFFLDTITAETRYRSEIPRQNILRIVSEKDARGLFGKAVFIIGMNEGEMPALPRYELFDNYDRKTLNNISQKILGQSIWQTDTEYFNEEKLSFAIALTRATKKIFFSRTPVNEKGTYFSISHFLRRILDKNTNIHRIPFNENASENSEWDNSKIFIPLKSAEHYYEYTQLNVSRVPKISSVKTQDAVVYIQAITHANQYFDNEKLPDPKILEYFGYIPTVEKITEKYSQSEIYISATGLEKFGRCRYQGLWQGYWKLKPRKLPEYRPEAADYGTLYHHVLELYIKYTREYASENFYDPLLLEKILKDYINTSAQERIFRLDYYYLFTMISLFLKNTEMILREEQEALYFELESGKEELPFQKIFLNETQSLIGYGRIDRINRDRIENSYSIIDYKTRGLTHKDYQKIPFNLFQGFIYATILNINNKTPIKEILYISLEKQEMFQEFPAYKPRKGNLYSSIEEFYNIKTIEVNQLLSLLAQGNFSPFTSDEDIKQELIQLFSEKFGENFPREYQNKCRYCELHRVCLRKNKALGSY